MRRGPKMRRGPRLGLSTPILSSTSQYLPHPSRQQIHSSSHQAKHRRVHLDHSLPLIKPHPICQQVLSVLSVKYVPNLAPSHIPTTLVRAAIILPGFGQERPDGFCLTSLHSSLKKQPKWLSGNPARITPLLQWLPSLLESKLKSAWRPTRCWFPIFGPQLLLTTFIPSWKGPSLLLQQPGRLCIFCSFPSEPSSSTNPHNRYFPSSELLLLGGALPNHSV